MRQFASILIILLIVGCGNGENRRAEQIVSEASGLLHSRSDSALRLIENIDPGKISRRSTRAEYALVYSAALDKNYVDVDRDSLIAIADRYYANHPCSDSLRAVIDYYRGRVCQNAGKFTQGFRIISRPGRGQKERITETLLLWSAAGLGRSSPRR